ncbi:hypothetical protein [Streptomyces californicus]|uniref:hypothetical protein n=1 Tax=Streptomyces californicus TaxID=67351 RepID=UPI00332362DB
MTDTSMTPDVALARLRQYGERTSTWSTATHHDGTEKALHQIAVSLAAEVDRLRAEMSRWRERTQEAETSEAQLKGRVRGLRAQVDELEEQGRFMERNTLPDLHRQIEHHKEGKARWQKRAETAEARVAELTITPANEAVEMAEAEAELEVMRREHPAPCRVPDSPDCTCPSTERLLAGDELKRAIRGHLFGGGTP